MSCAELMYHQNLSSGFPYHHPHHQRSIADVYYSNYNSASAACSDYDAQAGGGNVRMPQSLGRETSSSSAAASAAAAGAIAAAVPQPPPSSTDFSSSPSSLSLGVGGSSSSPPHHHHQLSRGADSGIVHHQQQPLSLSPPSHHHSRPPPTNSIPVAAATTSSSSSPSSASPLLAGSSASTLSPSLSYFPTPASSSSSSSAFTSRPPTQGYNAAFPPAPPSSSFLPSSSSLLPSSSYSSSLKRSPSHLEQPNDVSVPKKTQYVTSNCVVLTYHDKETSSEVDDHFSKALSASSSPCSYGSGATTRHSSTDSPPMSQRNFPPSFWDAQYYHQHYGYQAFSGASSTQGGFLGSPHDALYPLPTFLSGSLGAPSLHHPLSSLHKDPWAGFPFGSGSKSTLNYYPYPRVTYPDLSASYGSMSSGGGSSRLSSGYGSLLLPTSSVRSGHFPSATITSAQCASGDLGSRVTSLTGEHSRNHFHSSGVAAPDGSGQTAGKDLHWF